MSRDIHCNTGYTVCSSHLGPNLNSWFALPILFYPVFHTRVNGPSWPNQIWRTHYPFFLHNQPTIKTHLFFLQNRLKINHSSQFLLLPTPPQSPLLLTWTVVKISWVISSQILLSLRTTDAKWSFKNINKIMYSPV